MCCISIPKYRTYMKYWLTPSISLLKSYIRAIKYGTLLAERKSTKEGKSTLLLSFLLSRRFYHYSKNSDHQNSHVLFWVCPEAHPEIRMWGQAVDLEGAANTSWRWPKRDWGKWSRAPGNDLLANSQCGAGTSSFRGSSRMQWKTHTSE